MIPPVNPLLFSIALLAAPIIAHPPLQQARDNRPNILPQLSSSSPFGKPPPPDPYTIHSYPLPTDSVTFHHYGAPIPFDVLATAAIDGWGIAYSDLQLATRAGHHPRPLVPGGEYKRIEHDYQIDMGKDLYAEGDFTLNDLTLILTTIFQWGKTFESREFEFQWMRRGKFHVIGSLKNGRVGARNGTAVA